jgi:hypothetical protein
VATVVEERLAATLDYAAANVPYYQSLRLAGDRSLELGNFPIIDATTVAAAPELFYRLARFPDFVLTTGGTTCHGPVFLPVNYDELDLALRARLERTDSARNSDGFLVPERFDGVALHLTDLQHGLLLPPAHGQPVVSLPLEVGRHLPMVHRLLSEGLIVNDVQYPVVELFGSITKLRALTCYCEALVDGVPASDVRRITTMAFHTSDVWCQRLAEYWAARVVTSYGLTEFIQAVAAACPACQGFHLPPTVHAEFLALDLSEPVDDGPALLVLTALFPYRTSMPLIRYNTRDIVELLPICLLTGTRGFQLHGRQGSVVVDRGRVWLTAFDVLDAVDAAQERWPGAVCYDEAVATAMSWGSGCDRAVFRNCGYPVLCCRTRADTDRPALEVIVETAGTPRQREGVGKTIAELLSARASERFDERPSGPVVRVESIDQGELAARGLPLTLV